MPFWIGGELHPRNLSRLVRFGRGWIPSPTARRREIAADVERLDAALAEAGRAPEEVRVRVGLPVARDEQERPAARAEPGQGPGPAGARRHRRLRLLRPVLPRPRRGPRFFGALAAGFRASLA